MVNIVCLLAISLCCWAAVRLAHKIVVLWVGELALLLLGRLLVLAVAPQDDGNLVLHLVQVEDCSPQGHRISSDYMRKLHWNVLQLNSTATLVVVELEQIPLEHVQLEVFGDLLLFLELELL